MDIVVCIKRVPDLSEADLVIDKATKRLDVEDLDHGVNEWDNFAIETAVRLKEQHGGRVTALTVGDAEAEEVLRRALAMGADDALHVQDAAFDGADAWCVAVALQRALAGRKPDLVLCGAISSDGSNAQVGGMLAGLLGLPQVALATGLEVAGGKATVRHEVEGGLERVVELALPAVVTVQTGIFEPRYVSIRGIKKVADVAIPRKGAADLGLKPGETGAAGSRVLVEEMFLPPKGKGAQMLEGDVEDVVAALVGKLRERGGL
jgi:electron transfer flavoprotein beta subunit